MSSTELADVAGVSSSTLYKLENNPKNHASPATVMRLYRSLEAAGRLSDAEWSRFRSAFGLAESVRLHAAAPAAAPNERGAAASPSVQLTQFLRSLDANRATAMQVLFELMDWAGADRVVEFMESSKRMMQGGTVGAMPPVLGNVAGTSPGTLVHRRETVRDGYRVTELSPHRADAGAEKQRAKKIGG